MPEVYRFAFFERYWSHSRKIVGCIAFSRTMNRSEEYEKYFFLKHCCFDNMTDSPPQLFQKQTSQMLHFSINVRLVWEWLRRDSTHCDIAEQTNPFIRPKYSWGVSRSGDVLYSAQIWNKPKTVWVGIQNYFNRNTEYYCTEYGVRRSTRQIRNRSK